MDGCVRSLYKFLLNVCSWRNIWEGIAFHLQHQRLNNTMMSCQEQFPAIGAKLKAASVCNRSMGWVQVFMKAPLFFPRVDFGIHLKMLGLVPF